MSIRPKTGQVYEKNGLRREVCDVLSNSRDARDVSVGWKRPDNDWRTRYVEMRSWMRWVAEATLVHTP